jgi:hypothetical protein
MDRELHVKGPEAIDKGQGPEGKKEPGYIANLMKARGLVSDTLGTPLDQELYTAIFKAVSAHLDIGPRVEGDIVFMDSRLISDEARHDIETASGAMKDVNTITDTPNGIKLNVGPEKNDRHTQRARACAGLGVVEHRAAPPHTRERDHFRLARPETPLDDVGGNHHVLPLAPRRDG